MPFSAWVSVEFIYVRHDSCNTVTRLMHMCDMTHSHMWNNWCLFQLGWLSVKVIYVWHDSCNTVTRLMHTCDVTHSYIWNSSCFLQLGSLLRLHLCDMTHATLLPDSCTCVTWLTHIYDLTFAVSSLDPCWCICMCETLMRMCDMTCDVTRCHVRQDSWICLVNMCDMTHSYTQCDLCHSYVRHDTFIRATLDIHMCDITHSYVGHEWFVRAAWLVVEGLLFPAWSLGTCVMWRIYAYDMIYSHVWHNSFTCVIPDSFVGVTWLIRICDMHFPAWKYTCIYVLRNVICASVRICIYIQIKYVCAYL